MAKFTDKINVLNKLEQDPITVLIIKAKALVRTMGYRQSTIWRYNVRFNDLQRNAAVFNIEKLSKEFIARYIEEGAQRSPTHIRSSAQRKGLLNLIAAAVSTAPIFLTKKILIKSKPNVFKRI